MVKVGETSGKLPQVLGHLAAYLETQEDVRSRVTTALVYPCVLASLSVAVLVFFIVRIVPTFAEIFDSFGAQLPPLTRVIIRGSEMVQRYFFLIVGFLAALVAIARSWARTDDGARALDGFSRRAPVVGDFFQAVHAQRLVSTLGLMLESGVEIVNALDVLGDVFANQPAIRGALLKARERVVAGDALSASLARTGVLPSLVTEMTATGEESGKLTSLLGAANRYYLKRMDQFLRRFTAVIDPILVVFIGGIVVVVVMSIMMPVISLSQLRR
jgi:type II secretory pathway component PulF